MDDWRSRRKNCDSFSLLEPGDFPGSGYRFISQKGWRAFEDLLKQINFDLFELDRPGVV